MHIFNIWEGILERLLCRVEIERIELIFNALFSFEQHQKEVHKLSVFHATNTNVFTQPRVVDVLPAPDSAPFLRPDGVRQICRYPTLVAEVAGA